MVARQQAEPLRAEPHPAENPLLVARRRQVELLRAELRLAGRAQVALRLAV
jgi:hypothetical protein